MALLEVKLSGAQEGKRVASGWELREGGRRPESGARANVSAREAQDAPPAASQERTPRAGPLPGWRSGESGCSRLPEGRAWAAVDWEGEEGTSAPLSRRGGDL